MKWLPEMDPNEICLMRSGKETVFTMASIYIMSYDIAKKLSFQFLKRGINMIIVDEAHALKSNQVSTIIEIIF